MKIKAFYWRFFNKEKYRLYEILCWIKAAKEHYVKVVCKSRRKIGLCGTLAATAPNCFYANSESPESIMPEYTPEYLGATGDEYSGFWWDIEDTKPRIEALNKLIQVYKDKLKD